MTTEFDVNNPVGNDILVYDEISKKFVNTRIVDVLPPPSGIQDGANIGTGSNIFNDIVGGVMRFRSLVGTDGISTSYVGSDIHIKFNGNATTVAGQGIDNLVLVSNQLGDIDPVQGRANLGVYSAQQSDDLFMEANGSNIPDLDNTYDLGSNGRRYADIYAVTFHGTATESIIAQKLERNGASDGQILVWRTASNAWMPEDSTGNRISALDDVVLDNLENGSILVYNGVLNRWESVPSASIGGGGTGGSTIIEDVGTGTSLIANQLGSTVQLRSIKAANNTVNVTTNFNGEEILISANVPQSTDELVEGSNNLYFTNQRAKDAIGDLSIQDLDRVNGSPINGQAPVWNGTEWVFQTVTVDISTTDDLPEGSTNLYFTNQRVDNAIANYIIHPSKGISLSQLKDVNATPTDGLSLVFDGTTSTWVAKQPSITKITGFNTTGIQEGNVMVWNTSSGGFVPSTMSTSLIELSETVDSLHFNQASFDSMFSQKTTDDLPATSTNQYLTLANLQGMVPNVSVGSLGGMEIGTISDGNIVVWDAAQNAFVPASSEDLNVTVNLNMADLGDVDNTAMANIQEDDILIYQGGKFVTTTQVNRITQLTDVNMSGMTNGQGLVWDSANTEFKATNIVNFTGTVTTNDILKFDGTNFVPTPITALSGNLAGLGDVQVTNIQDNDLIVWNNVSSVFENTSIDNLLTLSVLAMDDVDASTIQANEVLVWDGSSFVNKTGLFGVDGDTHSNGDLLYFDTTGFRSGTIDEALNIAGTKQEGSLITVNASNSLEYKQLSFSDISDLQIGTVNNGEKYLLGYDGTDYVLNLYDPKLSGLTDFVVPSSTLPHTISGDGAGGFTSQPLEISLASDVQISTIQDGDILQWNGTEFVNTPLLVTTDIQSLTDVSVSNLQTNDVLVWDGSYFVNQPAPQSVSQTGDLSDVDETVTPTNGDVLTYNSATGKYEPAPVDSTPTSLGGVYERKATQGQTSFVIPHDGTVIVFANGIILPNSEVDLSNLSQVTVTTPRNANDTMKFMVLADANAAPPPSPSVYALPYEFIATQGQVEFIAAHEGMVMVFAGGVILPDSEYDNSDISKITLTTPRNAGDTVKIVAFQS